MPDDLGTVFISYTHDSADHAQTVLELSNRLRSEGIDCVLDRYVSSPPEGWPQWMDREITKAQFVLMICTEAYNRRVMGQETAGKGLGIAWEGHLIYTHLYIASSRNTKFLPVILDEAHIIHIPAPLQGATRYCLSTPQGHDALYTRLIGLPPTEKPPLGRRRALPPREVKTTFNVETHVQSPMNAMLEMVVNRETPAPKTALRFVPIAFPQCFWHIGRRGTEPSMQIVTDWHVTNISQVPVRLLSARLLQPQLDDREAFSVIFTADSQNSMHQANVAIPPGETWHTTIQFYTGPPVQEEGKPLKVEFVVIDQYTHEHSAALTLRYF